MLRRTHGAAYALAEDFLGVTALERYAMLMEEGCWDRGRVFDHSSQQGIGAIYLDIVDALKPDLATIDFSIGVEGDGPGIGEEETQCRH